MNHGALKKNAFETHTRHNRMGEGDDYARRKHASCAHVCGRMGPYASQVEKATTTRDASSALPSGRSAKAEAATRPAPTGDCSVSICTFLPVNQVN